MACDLSQNGHIRLNLGCFHREVGENIASRSCTAETPSKVVTSRDKGFSRASPDGRPAPAGHGRDHMLRNACSCQGLRARDAPAVSAKESVADTVWTCTRTADASIVATMAASVQTEPDSEGTRGIRVLGM